MRRKILKKKYKNLCKLLLGGAAFLAVCLLAQTLQARYPLNLLR